MQITLHLGPHHSDADLLLQALRASEGPLARQGCVLPDLDTYRTPLREACTHRSRAASELWLPELLELSRDTRAAVLVHEGLLGADVQLLRDGRLYAETQERIGRLVRAVPRGSLLLSLSLVHPARFLAAMRAGYGEGPGTGAMAALDPANLSWLPVVADLRRAAPEAPLLVWRHDDLPVLLRRILIEMAGLAERELGALPDAASLAAPWLPHHAIDRLRRYLLSHPPLNPDHESRILRAFLSLFVEPPPPPGDGAADRAFREDIARIRRMEGVMLLTA